jgi:thiamine pyrophosphokinase|nr:thiamine diphosphokinase [uncultured Oscillibacter sp.]
MRRCVIIGGADIGRYDRIRGYLREGDFYICCDSGLKHREGLDIVPDLIVGDFDSYENPQLNIETITLPREKDDTDTVFAVKEALSRGFQDFLLVGVIGGRLDHTLGNVSLLLMLDAQGKTATALDDFSEMEIVSGQPVQIQDCYTYFSLLNISGTAQSITIKNAKYPLDDAEITCEYQYGISNEVLPGKIAVVTVNQGRLLLIKVLP